MVCDPGKDKKCTSVKKDIRDIEISVNTLKNNKNTFKKKNTTVWKNNQFKCLRVKCTTSLPADRLECYSRAFHSRPGDGF